MSPAPADARPARTLSTAGAGTNVTIFTSCAGSSESCGVSARQSPAILPTVHHVNGSNGHRFQEPSEEDIVPLRELERRAIQRALRATHGSVGRAAKLLGIGRATLYRRLAELELGSSQPPGEVA